MQIGDLVLTTPLFRAIKAAYPNYFLAAAVNSNFADLVRFNPFINLLFDINKRSFSSTRYALHTIRNLNFDLCINLNSSERASTLAIASGAKLIVGYANFPFSLFFNLVSPNLNRVMHQVRSHFLVLRQAGFLNLNLQKSDVFLGNTTLNLNLPDNIVAFNCGASWPSKRWLPEFFAQLANALIQRGFYIAILGSSSDLPIAQLVASLIHDKSHLLSFTGKFSLLQLAAFFDKCKLLISNDSGPLHIAAARNLPAVSIFGSSPTIGFAPWLNSHILIKSPAPCHPCYKHVCPRRGDSFMACMKAIPPDFVLNVSLDLLASRDTSTHDQHFGDFDCKIIDLAKQN